MLFRIWYLPFLKIKTQSHHIQNRSFMQATAELAQPQHILDIFQRKVEHSNIDLKTYLNNLNYFSTEPIGNIPAMNLSAPDLENEKKQGNGYYLLWAIINLLLVIASTAVSKMFPCDVLF